MKAQKGKGSTSPKDEVDTTMIGRKPLLGFTCAPATLLVC